MNWLSGLLGVLLGVTACAAYARIALQRSRLDAETWRTRYESERLERAKSDGLAQQLADDL